MDPAAGEHFSNREIFFRYDCSACSRSTAKIKKITNHLGDRYLTSARDYFEKKNYLEAMVKQYNFFEAQYNKNGHFESYSEKIKKGNAYLIIDYTMGLVWYNGWGPGKMDFEKAGEWIVKQNKIKYGGFSDWRFPTLEEAASLLRKRKNRNGLHIDTLFTGNQKAIWTGDRSTVVVFKGRKYWVVFFDQGILEKSYKDNEHDVLAVRTLK